MPNAIETDNCLEVRDQISLGMRVILLLLALFPWIAPYQLLIKPDWETFWHPFFVFAALISLGAITVSAFFVWAAVAGLNHVLRFDRQRNTFTYTWDAPIVRSGKSEYPLSAIRQVGMETHDWSDGSPSYALKVEMSDGQAFKSGSSYASQEIEAIQERVNRFLPNRENFPT